ncbi:DUF1294 domain-containing protein [Sporomusa aerivorans]|uniref:DUF1294 domain-containing protein n=1 Tax=Sporomusa aerivorans TaxID=204936 RepID=UPI00352B05C7
MLDSKLLIWSMPYLFWNLAAFLLVRLDKRRACKKEWRIRERTFFFIALFFGAAGVLSGMYTYRHKTRHWSFILGIPVLFLVNLIWGYILWK